MMHRTRGWTRSTCRSRCVGAATTGPRPAGWRPRLPAAWKRGAAGAPSSAAGPSPRWHRLCASAARRWSMKLALPAVAVLLLAGPALAAPGDPRTVRGSLEWPASLSAEPFVVVRGDDGRLYYADVSSAQRMNAGAISGRISVVGVEGTQPHEVHAVVIGAGDSALTFATPTVPTPAEAASAPSSLPRQAVTPTPSAAVPYAPPPPARPTPVVPGPAASEDLWQIQGKVTAITPRE